MRLTVRSRAIGKKIIVIFIQGVRPPKSINPMGRVCGNVVLCAFTAAKVTKLMTSILLPAICFAHENGRCANCQACFANICPT